ncbi:RluA family pseudouridine synthase [Devosia sp.]|uniref:RluA family pseudouridine synthase n=1 Tax=Devosia sp. TaxID=1871048 RepID=UPI003BABC118
MQDVSGEDMEWLVSADAETAGDRLDAVLAKAVPAFSRNRIKDLILSGSVAINGRALLEPNYRLKAGDEILLVAPEPVDADPTPENIPLDILYEDNDLIVINKPVGMVVHPAPGNLAGTLVNALLYHCGDSLAGIGGVKRPGIVHRLDKDTSGVMVAAKTERAHNHLAAQFADHGRTGPLHRAYIAFAWGRTQQAKGTVDAPIGRDANNRLKQAIRKDGREAITHYAVEARYGDEGWDITRIKCELETGRTHQIRVHMAHIGHPLVADQVYASGFVTKANRLPETAKVAVQALGRQALHAAELGFEHPRTGEEMFFEAPLPADLQALQDAIEPYNLAFAR